MANIFFGRGKREKLLIETSRMGMRVISMSMVEENIQINKALNFWWSGNIYKTPEDYEQEIEKALRSISAEFPPKQHSVVYCHTDADNTQRFVQTAVIEDEEELEEFLFSKKMMPDATKYLSDMYVSGPSISDFKKSQDVMVYSMRKDFAQPVMDTLEDLGYELEALEFPANSLSGVYEYLVDEDSQTENDVLINIGWDHTSVGFFHNGELRMGHYLSFGLRWFVDILVNKLQMEEQQALTYVMGEFFPVLFREAAPTMEIPEDLLEAAGEELVTFLDELQRLIGFYKSNVMEFKVENIGRFVFTGLEVQMPQLQKYVTDYFIGIPAVEVGLFDFLTFPDEVKSKWDAEGMAYWMHVPVGLAIRNLES
jgi:Tfp pilus assembly PilM family ATPase